MQQIGRELLRPLPLLPGNWYWSSLVYCDHYHFCCDFGTGRGLFSATCFPFIWNPDCHIQKPSYIAARGCIVKVCMPSLFLEYWGKIAPILNLECPYVSDGISKPCRVFQCFYRSVKVCHIVSLGKIDTPLCIVESIFTQDYPYREISVVVWLSIILFRSDTTISNAIANITFPTILLAGNISLRQRKSSPLCP